MLVRPNGQGVNGKVEYSMVQCRGVRSMVWEERRLVSFLIRQTLRHCPRMHWEKRRKVKKKI